MEEKNENKGKKLTQEEFNQIVQKQLNDLSRMFNNNKKKHEENESKRDDEENDR